MADIREKEQQQNTDFEKNYIDENIKADQDSKAKAFIKKFMKRKTAVLGLIVIVVLVIIAIIGPYITPYDYTAYDYMNTLAGPSPEHLFGTDQYGRDILSRMLVGTRLTLGVSLSAVVIGAALGTTLAQALSVLVAFIAIRRRRSVAVSRGDLHPRRDVMGQILGIGVPVALQDGLIQIAFILITVIANLRGLTDSAAVGIVEKLISFLFLVPSSMLSTVSAIGAQNIGAGDYGRAKQTMWYAIGIAVGFGIIVCILFQFIAEPVVGLFTSDEGVIAAGGQYMHGYIFDCLFAGIHFCFSGYFCACGKSGISFLHNSLSILLVRVPGAYLASKYFPQTLLPMGLANAAGSLFSILVCVIAYAILTRREKRAQEAT